MPRLCWKQISATFACITMIYLLVLSSKKSITPVKWERSQHLRELITTHGAKPWINSITAISKGTLPEWTWPYLHSRLSELIWSATRLWCWRKEGWEMSPCAPATAAPRSSATSIRHRAKSKVKRRLCTVSVCSCWTPEAAKQKTRERVWWFSDRQWFCIQPVLEKIKRRRLIFTLSDYALGYFAKVSWANDASMTWSFLPSFPTDHTLWRHINVLHFKTMLWWTPDWKNSFAF